MLLSKYGNYGPPPGTATTKRRDPLWQQDEPPLKDYNVPEMVARFERAAAEQAGWFQGADANEKGGRGGDVMFTMGTDFTYGAAGYWYDQLDRLARNVNQRAGRSPPGVLLHPVRVPRRETRQPGDALGDETRRFLPVRIARAPVLDRILPRLDRR